MACDEWQRWLAAAPTVSGLRQEILERICANATVLNVGCAGGAVVEAAKRCGYRCTGLEPSREQVEPRPGRAAPLAVGRLERPAGMRPPRHGQGAAPGLLGLALHELWSRSAAQNSARPSCASGSAARMGKPARRGRSAAR
jgi:hypothetical protein